MEIVVKTIHGVSRPNSGLRFVLEVKGQGQEYYSVFGYSITCSLGGVQLQADVMLLTFQVSSVLRFEISPTFRIDPYTFHLIEEARAGGDLFYDLGMTLLTGPKPGPEASLNPGNVQAFNASVFGARPKISQADWADYVRVMGFGDRVVLEIPFAQPPVQPTTSAGVQTAANRLQEARGLFFEGKTDDVVARCRKALEALNPAVSAYPGRTPVSWDLSSSVGRVIDTGSPGQPSKPSKSQRLSELTVSLWEYLHIGPHENYQVFHEDAELALRLTSMVVRYYSLQLEKTSGSL